ncbi:MAG: hypothetical protein JST79_21985 [Acidobacteria bacterium]|nr:hypothetical protein [Acidobacteriota bacterium]
MPTRRLSPSRFAGCLLFLAMASLAAPAQSAGPLAGEAAQQLAAKIAAITGRMGISLEVSNRSSLSSPQVEEVRRTLQNALAAAGVRVSSEPVSARVGVTLSEDLQSYVWIGEIQRGDDAPTVVMVTQARPPDSRGKSDAIALTIRKTSLWSQSTRILDVAFWGSARMLVLDPANVTVYQFQERENRWQVEQTLPIAHARPWPRDLRGRLLLRNDQDHVFDAYLPGVLCRSSQNMPLSMSCAESDDPWPLYTDPYYLNAFFSTARNFFTGAVSPPILKNSAVPFFSAAPVPRDDTVHWLIAGLDGQVHLLDGRRDTLIARTGWGSDMVSVHSNCGSGWQVLASSNGGPTGDFIRAYEVPDREPAPVSLPVVFSGEITALWTSREYNTAVAVSHDVEKETYEAFRLTLACGQ